MASPTYKYEVHCTHFHWIRKPDPLGYGKFVFHTNNLEEWKARCAKTGVRVDRVITRPEGQTS